MIVNLPQLAGQGSATAWLWLGALVLSAVVVTYVALLLAHAALRRRSPPGFRALTRLAPPLCLLSASLVLKFTLPALVLGTETPATPTILVILACAWTAVALTSGIRHWLYAQFDISQADNLRARTVRTQLGFIEKFVDLCIILAALATAAYQLPWGRTLGTSLLASAGVASLVVGLAGQKTLGNLIAGFQIAFTQPIRIGDAVVAEGEWGWIEEVTLTYVVVRIWDLRRLVLPITYFIEKPFQNWTRTSGQILGSVHLTVSHFAPFAAIEKRFEELLDASPHWDRETHGLQVTDSSERCVVIRALMTAKDSPTCWDLRCEIRRGLLEFLAEHYPEALPTVRIANAGEPPPIPTA